MHQALRGLALDDMATILAGAVIAAVMALAVQGIFEMIDRMVIPEGLQHASSSRESPALFLADVAGQETIR